MKSIKISLSVEFSISEERIRRVLIDALESTSIVMPAEEMEIDKVVERIFKGKEVILSLSENDTEDIISVESKNIKNGLISMASKNPEEFFALFGKNANLEFSEMYLQYCLFGKTLK